MNNKKWKITRDRVEIYNLDGTLKETATLSDTYTELAREVDISVPIIVCFTSIPLSFYSLLLWITVCICSLVCSLLDSFLGYPNTLVITDKDGFDIVYRELDYIELYGAFNKAKNIHENFLLNSKLNLEECKIKEK